MSRAGLRTLVIGQRVIAADEYVAWNREFEVGGPRRLETFCAP
jgi:hypothetical protein